MTKHEYHMMPDGTTTSDNKSSSHHEHFDIIKLGARYQVVDTDKNEPTGWLHRTRDEAVTYMQDKEAEYMREMMFPGYGESGHRDAPNPRSRSL